MGGDTIGCPMRVDYMEEPVEAWRWGMRKGVLSKEQFRSIMCEFRPTIAEDSGQPEWSQGELDKAYDALLSAGSIPRKEEGKKSYGCGSCKDAGCELCCPESIMGLEEEGEKMADEIYKDQEGDQT